MLLLALMLVIGWLAFSPRPPPQADTGWDKGNHALAFGALAVVADLAFRAWPQRLRWVVAGLLAYGAFIELVQAQIPDRTGEWPDLLADGVGIALGLLALATVQAMRRWFTHRAPPARF